MIIQCRSCSKKLRVPDSAGGKKVKCPGCSNVIFIDSADNGSGTPAESTTAAPPKDRAKKRAPAKKKSPSTIRGASARSGERPAVRRQSPPKRKRRKRPADDLFGDDFGDMSQGEDYDDPENPYAAPRATEGGKKRKGKRGRRSEGLGTVGVGLLVQGWAIVGTILMVAVFVLIAMASGPQGGIGSGVMLLGVGSIVAGITMLIGEVMCLAAPGRFRGQRADHRHSMLQCSQHLRRHCQQCRRSNPCSRCGGRPGRTGESCAVPLIPACDSQLRRSTGSSKPSIDSSDCYAHLHVADCWWRHRASGSSRRWGCCRSSVWNPGVRLQHRDARVFRHVRFSAVRAGRRPSALEATLSVAAVRAAVYRLHLTGRPIHQRRKQFCP